MAWETRIDLNDRLFRWKQLLVSVAAQVRPSLLAVALAAPVLASAASAVTLGPPAPLRAAPAYATDRGRLASLAAVQHGLTAKPYHERFVLIGDSFEDVMTPVIGISMIKMMLAGTPTLVITISANTSNFVLYTAASSPSGKTRVICVVNNLVEVHATTVFQRAFDTGATWPSGSTLKLINNGFLTGAGGAGGVGGLGGADNHNGSGGTDGGDAVFLQYPMDIDNTNGYILSGGGGGGGGADWQLTGSSAAAGGGGAGGGLGNVVGTGGAGSSFSSAPGSNGNDAVYTSGLTGSFGNGGPGGAGFGVNGGDGGNGGDWGTAGDTGGGTSNHNGGAPGAAGYAVRRNGFIPTWLGGNNGTQVRGNDA